MVNIDQEKNQHEFPRQEPVKTVGMNYPER